MYNRYIPQSDGSFRRSPVEERQKTVPKPKPQPCPAPEPPCPPPVVPCPAPETCPAQEHKEETCSQPKRPPHREPQGQSITSFLKQLLPSQFDTGDLLIVLLLLLMAGDCQEDQNTALLTLVLYLFM